MEPQIPAFWQTAPRPLEWAALVLFLAWSLFGVIHFTYLKFKHGAEMPLDLRRYLAWRAQARVAGNGQGAGGNPGPGSGAGGSGAGSTGAEGTGAEGTGGDGRPLGPG